MLSNIPSWAVGLTGAAIAIAATVTSSTLLYGTRADTAAVRSQIADTRRTVDRLWSSHRQADQRSTAAGMFFGQALGPGPDRSFLLEQAAHQLRGAVLSMWAASGEPVPEQVPEPVAEAEHRLREGDARGYVFLVSEIERLRSLSQSHINGLFDDTRSAESRIESLQSRELWIYLAYVFFNVLGLIVTMCKDLPLWRAERHGTAAA